MPPKCKAPTINAKIYQKIDIEPGDIEKGDIIDYRRPNNVFWQGCEKVHSIIFKKRKLVVINAVGEHTHITFKHVRAIYKRQDNLDRQGKKLIRFK